MSESERTTDWIETYSGKPFWPLQPRTEDVNLDDLAQALATTNRFGGHAREPISVARHSLLVADIVPSDLCVAALLHDAEEAYLGDHLRPLKGTIVYRFNGGEVTATEMGVRVRRCIFQRFDIAWPSFEEWEAIEEADLTALATEARDLMASRGKDWCAMPDPVPATITPIGWREDKKDWMQGFLVQHMKMRGYL